ncbi:MAG: redox-regulated ATPase YchF [Chloroflexi bacterium]|nr:MAG: redox-regulated ATPase YchF [Chloroflexota bacterium]
MDALSEVYKTKKTTYAEIRWVDYPVGGFGNEGPGAQFVAEIAKMDAIVHVVRAFVDDSVPHPDETIDAHRDVEAMNLELTFVDLGLIERRLSRLDQEMRSMPAAQRGEMERHKELLQRMQAHLEGGQGLRAMTFTEVENKELRAYQLITRLPMLLIVNIGEIDLGRVAEIEAEFGARYAEPGVDVAALCAKIEAELAQMEPEDAVAFRTDLGLPPESPLDRAIVAAYELLGLQSFLTAGDDECRAWTVPVGATAPEAAGRIHSDLEKGFIRAEVATWQDVVAAKGSAAELKKAGKLRTEGKAYVVHDGDVINILFNL